MSFKLKFVRFRYFTFLILPLVFTNIYAQEKSWKVEDFATDDCSEWRLDKKGEAFYQYPTRNQNGVGNCYAHVVTKINDALRLYEGQSLEIKGSALATSIFMTSDDLSDNSISGGKMCDAFATIRDYGACDERLVEGIIGNGLVSDYIQHLENYKNKYRRFISRPEKQEKIIEKTCRYIHRRSSLDEILPSLKMIKLILQQDAADEMLDLIITDQACNWENRKKQMLQGSYNCNFSLANDGPVSLLQKVNELIKNTPHFPIGIGLCSEILCNRGAEGIKWITTSSGEYKDIKDYSTCTNHGTLIIGRRKNPKTNICEYLIHNSARPEDACHNKTSQTGGIPWPKEGDTFWVPANKLFINTFEIDYIVPNNN